MRSSKTPPVAGRREFLKTVAAAGLASAIPAGAGLLAQTPPAPSPTPAPAPPAEKKGPSAEAIALTTVLKARFGDRLTAEQWDGVTQDFDGDLAAGKRLAGSKLANGDEPDFTFRA